MNHKPQKYSNKDKWPEVPFVEESPLVLGDYAVFAGVVVVLILVIGGLL